MNDTRVMELIKEVTDSMVFFLFYCNIDEDAVLESKESSGGDPATLRDIGVSMYLIEQPNKQNS